MTAGQLRRGLEKMPRPCPAAILFGLDMSLTADQVITLKWKDALKLHLTEYAAVILNSQPRHIMCDYVFWKELRGKPMPLFGLDGMVFENFGLIWSELTAATKNVIWIDEVAEAEAFLKELELTLKKV